MRFITLTGGLTVKVSEQDYDALSRHTWWAHPSASGNIYAYTQSCKAGKKTTVYMHRMITGCPPNMEVDHEDKDTLNNQRPNLRITTPSRNKANRDIKLGRSGYRGVMSRWRPKSQKWMYEVWFTHNGDKAYHGVFSDVIEAAKHYDKLAVEAFGEFATLNFRSDWDFSDKVEGVDISETF